MPLSYSWLPVAEPWSPMALSTSIVGESFCEEET
ncbi:Uncharacterised protein [Mycobacteroides abscessus subsp. abscessus]|nr:Uncharacterised protein [Mycobacteroides abscessus subsp. abscessus]